MPECAETHLQQSRISKFSGGGKGGEGEGKGRREGKDSEGREGGREGGMGRGGALDMGSAPLETSSGSAPERNGVPECPNPELASLRPSHPGEASSCEL